MIRKLTIQPETVRMGKVLFASGCLYLSLLAVPAIVLPSVAVIAAEHADGYEGVHADVYADAAEHPCLEQQSFCSAPGEVGALKQWVDRAVEAGIAFDVERKALSTGITPGITLKSIAVYNMELLHSIGLAEPSDTWEGDFYRADRLDENGPSPVAAADEAWALREAADTVYDSLILAEESE